MSKRGTIVALLIEYKTKWPAWVRIVATSRPDPDTKGKLQPLSGASIDVHRKENREDVRDFVVATLERGLNQCLRSVLQCFELLGETDRDKLRRAPLCHGWRLWQRQPATVDAICAKAEGVFMYAREVLVQLSDNPRLDLNSLPSDLARLYMQRYEKTFPEDDDADQFDAHSRPMLAMLVAARAPLPEAVVEEAEMSYDGGGGAARRKSTRWKRERKRHLAFVRSMCSGSLVEVGKLQFSHKSFSDWLTGDGSGDYQWRSASRSTRRRWKSCAGRPRR